MSYSKILLVFVLLLTACEELTTDPNSIEAIPPLDFKYDDKMILALGGVQPSWDFIKIDNLASEDQVEISIDPPDLAQSHIYADDGQNIIIQIIPLQAGIGKVTYSINGDPQNDTIKLVIPPQAMIQILMGEARSIISQEVSLDANGRVKKDSNSETARALLSVVRNRMQLIDAEDAPYLFVVSNSTYATADLAMRYQLIIEANDNNVYQFSPVKPSDPSNEAYLDAANRNQLSFASRLLTYDQGLLTAAGIFDGSLIDNTDGAFGFYSPTKSQYENLLTGLNSTTLPSGIGTSDAQFPALAPIQIRILDTVSPQNFDTELPAFVFIGSRSQNDFAVLTGSF